MRTERRCVPRKRPGGISYFEFEEGSGGIVLDASEKGLAFQAADAIHRLGPNRIFISPSPEERIELNGDVVWTDRSKKTGGLRFIDLGVDSCNRIRDWLRQPGDSGVPRQGQEYAPRNWAAREQPPPVEPRTVPSLPPLLHPDLTWQSRDFGVRRGFLSRIATGFLIAVFGFACIALVENSGFVGSLRPIVANELIRLGEKLNGTTDSQSRNSTPLPDSARVPSPPPPAAISIPAASHPETLPRSDQVKSSAQNDSDPPRLAAAAPAAKKSAYHSAYSRTPSSARNKSIDASRLWSAVGAGSSAAEVSLARLYLEGAGVPRNCEQARVLLRAAVKSGSREAREQLQKLGIYGCR